MFLLESNTKPSDGAEMPFRERPTRAGLQVALETNGFSFGREFHRNNKRPWTMPDSVATRTVVMPVEATAHIVCDSDVVMRWVGVASEDVDDPFFDTMHAWLCAQAVRRTESNQFRSASAASTLFPLYGFACGSGRNRGPPSLARSAASYGETAFACGSVRLR
jgi:hypothetical protein